MARQVSYETVTEPQRVRREALTCDGCGRAIDPQAYDGDEANELYIGLNEGQCVSFRRRRDYCTACLVPIWNAICKLIKSDPDAEGSDPEEDD